MWCHVLNTGLPITRQTPYLLYICSDSNVIFNLMFSWLVFIYSSSKEFKLSSELSFTCHPQTHLIHSVWLTSAWYPRESGRISSLFYVSWYTELCLSCYWLYAVFQWEKHDIVDLYLSKQIYLRLPGVTWKNISFLSSSAAALRFLHFRIMVFPVSHLLIHLCSCCHSLKIKLSFPRAIMYFQKVLTSLYVNSTYPYQFQEATRDTYSIYLDP